MANYVLSANNRYYAAIETSYGVVPAINADDRLPGIRLGIVTQKAVPARRDKSGTRTYKGSAGGARKLVAYELETTLMASDGGNLAPPVGRLIQSALGGEPQLSYPQDGTLAADGVSVGFTAAHGLNEGSAITIGRELRFVETVLSATSVQLCAPVSTPSGPVNVLPAASFAPANNLPSLSLFDYWDPTTGVQRVLRGAGVDEMQIRVDGHEHGFLFRGPAAELIDSASWRESAASSLGGLAQFPAEPATVAATWSPVPGQLGEVWLGSTPSKVLTLTKALIQVKNNIETRNFELGSMQPLALSPGSREVDLQFEVYCTDASIFAELYHAAQNDAPVPLTLQLGNRPGAMAAVYVKSFVPQVPQYDDSENQLLWHFSASRAQGSGDDEIYVAVG